MADIQINVMNNEQDYQLCFPVMRELRPHLDNEERFIQQVARQVAQGYKLLAIREQTKVVAVAGYRLQENLLYGRFVYIDDLVVHSIPGLFLVIGESSL